MSLFVLVFSNLFLEFVIKLKEQKHFFYYILKIKVPDKLFLKPFFFKCKTYLDNVFSYF